MVHFTESIYRAAHQTSAHCPKQMPEFDAVELATGCHILHRVAFVIASRVKWLMLFRKKHDLKIVRRHLVSGEILKVTISVGFFPLVGFVGLESAGTLATGALDLYYMSMRFGPMPCTRKSAELWKGWRSRICRRKFASLAVDHLPGGKNGSVIGKIWNTVRIAADIKKGEFTYHMSNTLPKSEIQTPEDLWSSILKHMLQSFTPNQLAQQWV